MEVALKSCDILSPINHKKSLISIPAFVSKLCVERNRVHLDTVHWAHQCTGRVQVLTEHYLPFEPSHCTLECSKYMHCVQCALARAILNSGPEWCTQSGGDASHALTSTAGLAPSTHRPACLAFTY